MDKVYHSVDEAVADIPDGASIAIGGFFTAGTPLPLIRALAKQGAKNLTIICMQMGPGNEDISQLIVNKQIKKAICNYPFYRSVSRGHNSRRSSRFVLVSLKWKCTPWVHLLRN